MVFSLMRVNFACHSNTNYTLTYCYLVYFITDSICPAQVKHSIETKGFFVGFSGCYPFV
jgi:hypothetical protein